VTDQAKAQITPPATSSRLKLGGRFGGINADAIAKAEAALKSLSGQFAQWLDDEIRKLDAARAAVQANGWTPETSETLYLRAHDLKGLGSTYEFPLITRIAASLCKLTDTSERRAQASLSLVDSHIDAIKACVRDNMRDDGHSAGRALAEELERRVAQSPSVG
jgi:tRNA(Met) C34 N-acetyltransferase TmcA